MPRSRIFGLYLLVGIVALGAGMLVARFLGTSPTLPSAYTTPVPAAPTAAAAASAIAPTVADLPTMAASPVSPTALSAVVPPTATLELTLTPSVTPDTSGLGYIEYTVQRGDILKTIATQHGVTIEEILAINQIPNPDSLVVASVIRIPTQ